ncbi:hypothetical protein AB0M28_09585 [Streptomyces sp. NPDC051940]|uniref:hypothetical protein n=1 Tax=Streptomyces sp. NPDC051940 TaxID=3155675 RepID=UPI003441A510
MELTRAAGDGAWSAVTDCGGRSRELVQEWLTGLGFNRGAPDGVLIRLLGSGHVRFLYRDDLPDGVLEAAVVHPLPRPRVAAAETGRLSPAQWDGVLAATPERDLREALQELRADPPPSWASATRHRGIERPPDLGARPPGTPAEIAAMADAVPDITADDRTFALWWVAALYDDPDAMRQLAASAKLRIRRSVARAPHLPPDVVEALAGDEDRVVRLFLTESCDDATAGVLLDVWSWWHGSFSFPGRPRSHPHFPRRDLLRFADDPRPRVRMLALDDPASTAALVERFSRDADAEVRGRAAGDARLSPESAVRLLGDPAFAVQGPILRNPALPPSSLAPLLLDLATARDAAENPAVPVSVMHRMMDCASVPR